MKVYSNPATGEWALMPFIESDTDAEKVLKSFATNTSACPEDGHLVYMFTPGKKDDTDKFVSRARPQLNAFRAGNSAVRSFESYDDHPLRNLNSVASAETMATTLDQPVQRPIRRRLPFDLLAPLRAQRRQRLISPVPEAAPMTTVPETTTTQVVKEPMVYVLPFEQRDLMANIVRWLQNDNDPLFFLVWKEAPGCECGGSWLWAFSSGKTLSPLHHLPPHPGQRMWDFGGQMGSARGTFTIHTSRSAVQQPTSLVDGVISCEGGSTVRSATLSVKPGTFQAEDLSEKIRLLMLIQSSSLSAVYLKNKAPFFSDSDSFCSVDGDIPFCYPSERLGKHYLTAGLKQCKAKCKSFLHHSSSKLAKALKPAITKFYPNYSIITIIMYSTFVNSIRFV